MTTATNRPLATRGKTPDSAAGSIFYARGGTAGCSFGASTNGTRQRS
jgi:hypothetical protein